MLLVALLLVGCLLLGACSGDVDVPPPQASSATSSGDRSTLAQAALDTFVRALRERSDQDLAQVATSVSSTLLADTVANAGALDLRDLSMRYVDEGSELTGSQRSELGARAWAGSVELQYSYGGLDTAPARVETDVAFVRDVDRVRIAGLVPGEERTPLWLATALTVVRGPQTLTAVAGPAGRYPRLATRAVAQVRRSLPAWRGPLVVEVPASREQLDAALDADAGEYDEIAAVTTTEDGSLTPGAPVRVFVNPDVYGRLAERGAQVVMSHEATHVATGATFTDMPTWLLEGFADFVALYRAGVPVSLAAGQILPRIRKEGLPDRLPTSADLDPRADGLGATYEEAWLACRFLAQEYGRDRLIRFYRTVSDGVPSNRAFRQVLGTTQKRFVAQWRVDLADLAGVEPNA